MRVGTQFSGTITAGGMHSWFTHDWPPDWHVVWTVIPLTVRPGSPELDWSVAVQRASPTAVTYWITVRNLTGVPIDVEARYEILN
jgi:hypothetical protein